MPKLSIESIIEKIEQGRRFEAEAEDGSFSIKIAKYVPYFGTAIHAGHQIRTALEGKILLDEYERWFEEDPYTDVFISSMPIVMIGHDSRFEYDLNRAPEKAVYEEAWGKKVWKRPLNKKQKAESLKKHKNYYRVTHALVQKLESMFDGCVVYDMHSYNYKRWERDVPLFNIGIERVPERYHGYAEHWREQLSKIELSNIENQSTINDVFYGRGYNLQYIHENFDKTLVLATEVKKVYCDEETGENFPQIIRELRGQFKKAILSSAQHFAEKMTNWVHTERNQLLTKDLDRTIRFVDRRLYEYVRSFELLNFVNPINLEKEQKRFLKKNGSDNPSFEYRPVEVDPFELKRRLLDLPVDQINDISIQDMYEATINGFMDKIDMLDTLGTDQFLFNSLRYFGKPSKNDLRNAQYLLLLPPISSETSVSKRYGAKETIGAFKEGLKEYGFKASVVRNTKMVADVMVLNQEKKILVKDGIKIRPKHMRHLIHHEVGVHMVTTFNSLRQPLKIFNVGHPVNTFTQEGLAVLSEYLSGNMTLTRLKKIAVRVIAVDMLCNGAEFKDTFWHLKNEYKLDDKEAFTITTRVYRGGGFTKDYLYLKGFIRMYHFWKDANDLTPLLIGKTSLPYYKTIVEMIDRGQLEAPYHITKAFQNGNSQESDAILEFIISGLRK